MNNLLNQLQEKAKEKQKQNKQFLNKIKKKPARDLDKVVSKFDSQVFSTLDCLSCANCCKTTGPLFTSTDIKRISKFLKLSEKEFEQIYLREDEDNDYVLKELPCSFLDENNRCFIYEVRPKACREYPHTNQKGFHKFTKETLHNTFICPAVFEILEKLKRHYE